MLTWESRWENCQLELLECLRRSLIWCINGTTDITYRPVSLMLEDYDALNREEIKSTSVIYNDYRIGWTNPLKVITYPTIEFIFILNDSGFLTWIEYSTHHAESWLMEYFSSPLCKNLSHYFILIDTGYFLIVGCGSGKSGVGATQWLEQESFNIIINYLQGVRY